MTSNKANDCFIEIHKKFTNLINLYAENKDYNVIVVFPQKKMHKYYVEKNLINFDKVTVIKAFEFIKISQGDKIYNIDFNHLYENFTEDNYDAFVYFSAPMNLNKGFINSVKESENLIVQNKMMIVSYNLVHIGIPILLQRKYNNMKVFHFINDFNEGKYSDYIDNCETYSYYKTSDGLKSSNIFDYDLKLHNNEKHNLFSFAFTISVKPRLYLSNFIAEKLVCTDTIKKFELNKYVEERNNPINQTDYYKILSESKFTLVAPSTYKNRFSYLRFVEALQNKCIPLLLEDSNYEDVIDFINSDLFDIYKKYNLFVSYNESINEKLLSYNYENIWNEIENSQYFKDLLDNDYKLNKLLNLV